MYPLCVLKSLRKATTSLKMRRVRVEDGQLYLFIEHMPLVVIMFDYFHSFGYSDNSLEIRPGMTIRFVYLVCQDHDSLGQEIPPDTSTQLAIKLLCRSVCAVDGYYYVHVLSSKENPETRSVHLLQKKSPRSGYFNARSESLFKIDTQWSYLTWLYNFFTVSTTSH